MTEKSIQEPVGRVPFFSSSFPLLFFSFLFSPLFFFSLFFFFFFFPSLSFCNPSLITEREDQSTHTILHVRYRPADNALTVTPSRDKDTT